VEKRSSINIFFQRPLWLLMAMFCVVFSSATKKLVELRFERKVNPQYAAFQLVNKKIKDGCRDKRHYLKSKVQVVKQQAPDTDVQGSFLAPDPVSFTFSPKFESFAHVVASGQQPTFAAALPLYLRHHRLQV
jgi:hypothetical protein